jgi:hypothetical protein
MLAYHLEWHLRDALAKLLFHDTGFAAAGADHSAPVGTTEPSDAVKTKQATKRSAGMNHVMGFRGLLPHLRIPDPEHRASFTPRQTSVHLLRLTDLVAGGGL